MEKEPIKLSAEVLERFTFMRYFGLSLSDINNALFNIVAKSWQTVVKKHQLDYAESCSGDAGRVAWTKKIFLGGKLVEFLRSATNYLNDHIMHIPKGMTLPQDLEHLSDPDDAMEIKERIEELEDEIASMHEELKKLAYESRSYEKGTEILKLARRSSDASD